MTSVLRLGTFGAVVRFGRREDAVRRRGRALALGFFDLQTCILGCCYLNVSVDPHSGMP